MNKKQEIIAKCKQILEKNPHNRSCKYAVTFLELDEDGASKLNDQDMERFFKCIKTGIDNPDSSLGCYAMRPTDYSDFGAFFDKVIRDYHGDTSSGKEKKQHVTSWETDKDCEYNLEKVGLDKNISMRVRVGRNLVGTNLPGMMTKEDRIDFEKKMLPAFEQLISKYGGEVKSLSPDLGPNNEKNQNLISEDEYQSLVKDHVMFKDMSADPYLQSAGISSDWPYGRGCWQSADKSKIIWFGEEDQLRIMCMKEGKNLLSVFVMLKEMLSVLESIDGIEFAKDENYGYVTSCPSNLGTGMRASVHLQVPHLTADGTDTQAKAFCNKLGLSVRGVGGEHTPIGKDGTIDISPSSRLFITEAQVLASLYKGIESLVSVEKKLSDFVKTDVDTGRQDKEVPENSSSKEAIDEGVAIIAEDKRDDWEAVNFVLVEDNERQKEEAKEQNDNIESLKERAKKISIDKTKVLLPEIEETKSMSNQSPMALEVSPSPLLAIENE